MRALAASIRNGLSAVSPPCSNPLIPNCEAVALRAAIGLGDERQRQAHAGTGITGSRRQRQTTRALITLAGTTPYWAIAEAMRLCNDKTPEVQWAAVETLMAQRPSETNSILQLVKPSLDLGNQRRAAVLLGQQEDQGTLPEKNENRMRDASKAG